MILAKVGGLKPAHFCIINIAKLESICYHENKDSKTRLNMPKKKLKKITLENYLNYYYDIPYEGKTSAGKPLRKLKDITCPYRGIKII